MCLNTSWWKCTCVIPSLASLTEMLVAFNFSFFSNTSSAYPISSPYSIFTHYLSLISITLEQDAGLKTTVSYRASLQFVWPSFLHKAIRIIFHQQLFSVIRKQSSVTKLNTPSVLQGLQWFLVASGTEVKSPNTLRYVLYELSMTCPHF